MFSRPGRPPKRFLPPQFSSTPPLITPAAQTTPTQSTPTQPHAAKIKPSYDGKRFYIDYHQYKIGVVNRKDFNSQALLIK